MEKAGTEFPTMPTSHHTPEDFGDPWSHMPEPQPQPSPQGREDINVLALVKGCERYVFLYDDQSRAEALRVLGRFASNPELSFTWYDAAVLSQKIRQESQKVLGSQQISHRARFNLPLPCDDEDDTAPHDDEGDAAEFNY